jgi:hypothetical protein
VQVHTAHIGHPAIDADHFPMITPIDPTEHPKALPKCIRFLGDVLAHRPWERVVHSNFEFMGPLFLQTTLYPTQGTNTIDKKSNPNSFVSFLFEEMEEPICHLALCKDIDFNVNGLLS